MDSDAFLFPNRDHPADCYGYVRYPNGFRYTTRHRDATTGNAWAADCNRRAADLHAGADYWRSGPARADLDRLTFKYPDSAHTRPPRATEGDADPYADEDAAINALCDFLDASRAARGDAGAGPDTGGSDAGGGDADRDG